MCFFECILHIFILIYWLLYICSIPNPKHGTIVYMDQELKERIDAQDKKIEQIYISVEKTKKYIQWTIIVSVFCFVIPLIALVIIIPILMNSYTSMIGGLGL